MAERGRSPGAKGTAFPFAQRPQRSGPGPQQGAPGGVGKAKNPYLATKRAPAGGTPGAAGPKPGRPRDAAGPKPGGPRDAAGPKPGGPRGAAPQAAPADRPRAPAAAPNAATLAPAPAAAGEGGGAVRVSKLMAERGLCSRREADTYIERGWVFVDGQRVTELGTRALPGAKITLAPEAKTQQARQATILLHKPVGYVSGQPEPGFQPAVVLIRPDTQYRPKDTDEAAFEPRHLKGLAPAGRLDIDSTGLLVLTQDGRIARQLIGEDSQIEKEYLVRVAGQLADHGLALLNHGLSLDGKALRPAKVEWLNDDQLRFVLKEGKKRQIRRMCELVGLKVVGLKRVRMGKLRLGDLPLGKWRYLKPSEGF